MKFQIPNSKFQILMLVLLLLSGCQRLTPKLLEEREATIEELLKSPQDFQEVEVNLIGVLQVSKTKGLFLKDEDFEIKVSTKSSGIAPEDFLDEKVEVGGVLKEEEKETVLEMNWVGILPKEEWLEMAGKKRMALASFLEVAEEEIEIVSSEAVDWPNSALGAPEEGKMYFQVIIPGFKIIYEFEGETYEVHTNNDGSQAVLVNPRTEL